MRRGYWAGGGCVAIVVIAMLYIAEESFKEGLVDVDAIVFDGAFRRAYHHQSLPVLPANMPYPKINAYEWLKGPGAQIIRHAMGGGSDTLPRNSIEAFVSSIRAGFTVIEGDLRLTEEGDLICYHGDDSKQIFTVEYLAIMKKKQNVPCCFSDIAEVLRDNPKIYFIIDAKDDFAATYNKIVNIAPDVIARLIPQIYDYEQVLWVRKHDFAGAIFTSYKSALTTEQIFAYARHAHIKAVTITKLRASKLLLLPSDLDVFTHTIDDPVQAKNLFDLGFHGIYSNDLVPGVSLR